MGRGNESDDNVVRLPRDWLGPREELVPFGPSAGTTTPDDEAPRSADDFWGEQSSAVHDAVRAPSGHAPLEDEPEWFGSRGGGDGRGRRRRHSAQGPLRRSLARVRASCHGLSIRLSALRPRFPGRLANVKLAASLAAMAVLLAGLLVWNGTGHSPRAAATAHRSAQPPTTALASTGPSLTRVPHVRLGTPRPTSRRRSSASTRQHARAHRRHAGNNRSNRRGRADPAAAATVQPVHYTPPPASSTGTTGSSSGGATSSPSAAAASASAGPSSPRAFGSNGTLGPGSSPDS